MAMPVPVMLSLSSAQRQALVPLLGGSGLSVDGLVSAISSGDSGTVMRTIDAIGVSNAAQAMKVLAQSPGTTGLVATVSSMITAKLLASKSGPSSTSSSSSASSSSSTSSSASTPVPTPTADTRIGKLQQVLQGSGVSLDQFVNAMTSTDANVRLDMFNKLGNDRFTSLVNIYNTPDPQTTPKPAVIDKVMQTAGTVSGMAGMAGMFVKGATTGLKGAISTVLNSTPFAGFNAGLAAWNLFSGIKNRSASGIAMGAAMWAFSVYMLGKQILGKLIMMGWGPFIAIAAGITAAIIVLGLIFGPHASAYEKALEPLPTVYSGLRPVYSIALGSILALTGVSITPDSPGNFTINVPTVRLAALMANATPLDPARTTTSPYEGLFVEHVAGQDRLVIVSQGTQAGIASASVFTLKKGLQVASAKEPGKGYIEIMGGDGKSLNPDFVKALQSQAGLAAYAHATPTATGATTLQAAGAVNKYSVTY